MRQPYDKSSKWLIEHHADSILRLGGLEHVESWCALQAELIQPRKLPDGLVEVLLRGQSEPHLFLLELCTYPENRVPQELLEDLAMVFLDRGILPEVLTIVLHPKGRVRVPGRTRLSSPLGWSRWNAAWRVVELWKIPAARLLEHDDPGLVPWVPLTELSEPPETVFRRCREVIDRRAVASEHESLLVVTQILAGLRYNDPKLLHILGGMDAMIESPVLQDLIAVVKSQSLLRVLRTRFCEVPEAIISSIQAIRDHNRLDELTEMAARCKSLDDFAAALTERA